MLRDKASSGNVQIMVINCLGDLRLLLMDESREEK